MRNAALRNFQQDKLKEVAALSWGLESRASPPLLPCTAAFFEKCDFLPQGFLILIFSSVHTFSICISISPPKADECPP